MNNDTSNKNLEALKANTRIIERQQYGELEIELEPNYEEGLIELVIQTKSGKHSHFRVKLTHHSAMRMAYGLIALANPV